MADTTVREVYKTDMTWHLDAHLIYEMICKLLIIH